MAARLWFSYHNMHVSEKCNSKNRSANVSLGFFFAYSSLLIWPTYTDLSRSNFFYNSWPLMALLLKRKKIVLSKQKDLERSLQVGQIRPGPPLQKKIRSFYSQVSLKRSHDLIMPFTMCDRSIVHVLSH